MKKSRIFTTVCMVALFTILLCSFSNNVFAKKLSLEKMELELKKINHENLGIIIWDQRIQVTDRSQPESFLGYVRALVGIAYPYFPKCGMNFSDLMLEKIKNGYDKQGVSINTITSTPFETEEQILEKIKNYNHEKVLLIKLNKLHFDGYKTYDYIEDIELKLYDKQGERLFNKSIVEIIPLGSPAKLLKNIPIELQCIIENALNDHELIGKIEE
ncbi:MAG: hypothetical protein KKA81_14255 [Bacteroidetes bacterium]|nr:hypothetical protein [Bacteroidota bacterium]